MGSNTSAGADTQAVLDAVRRIVHALRASSRRAEKHVGISGAQLFVLQKLDDSPAMSLNELAARTHTHQSSVSVVVTRLDDRGLVERSRSKGDARSIRLTLTARGKRLMSRAPDLAQERLITGIQSLATARRRMLASTLTELAHAIDAAERVPAMFFEEGTRRARGGQADV
jgi:DNA-binding MarR family transcriptional regulator